MRAKYGEAQLFFHRASVYSGNDCLLWPFARSSYGYAAITVAGKTRTVHSLVCEIRNGTKPSSTHEVVHSCGNGHNGCVTPRHLHWNSHLANMQDKKRHGKQPHGEHIHNARLTEVDVRHILQMYRVESQSKLAIRFGVSRQQIKHIHAGRAWRHIER